MSIKDLMGRGIGFSPGSVKYIITGGLNIAAAVTTGSPETMTSATILPTVYGTSSYFFSEGSGLLLSDYLTQVQLLLHDSNVVFATTADYTLWINEARSWIAYETQCVRVLQIVPTVANQETYNFPTVGANGIASAVGVIDIAVPWGQDKPVINRYDWVTFQANFRYYNSTQTGYPAAWASQGVQGPVYLFPIPQQVYQTEWDTWCDVIALASDSDIDAIPNPFAYVVKYYAAYLALLNAQRDDDAARMYQRYEAFLTKARKSVTQQFLASQYGTRRRRG